MIPACFKKNGKFDPSLVAVEPYEIAYALHNTSPSRDVTQVRDNIALGKACGAYDPEPAKRWLALQRVSA